VHHVECVPKGGGRRESRLTFADAYIRSCRVAFPIVYKFGARIQKLGLLRKENENANEESSNDKEDEQDSSPSDVPCAALEIRRR
jgi:hypothetical protein